MTTDLVRNRPGKGSSPSVRRNAAIAPIVANTHGKRLVGHAACLGQIGNLTSISPREMDRKSQGHYAQAYVNAKPVS